jgi:hypothetical protein
MKIKTNFNIFTFWILIPARIECGSSSGTETGLNLTTGMHSQSYS